MPIDGINANHYDINHHDDYDDAEEDNDDNDDEDEDDDDDCSLWRRAAPPRQHQ